MAGRDWRLWPASGQQRMWAEMVLGINHGWWAGMGGGTRVSETFGIVNFTL